VTVRVLPLALPVVVVIVIAAAPSCSRSPSSGLVLANGADFCSD